MRCMVQRAITGRVKQVYARERLFIDDRLVQIHVIAKEMIRRNAERHTHLNAQFSVALDLPSAIERDFNLYKFKGFEDLHMNPHSGQKPHSGLLKRCEVTRKRLHDVQGHLAHNKNSPPPSRTTIGP